MSGAHGDTTENALNHVEEEFSTDREPAPPERFKAMEETPTSNVMVKAHLRDFVIYNAAQVILKSEYLSEA